eukprot:TRINITY_DN27527_c0_g1_i1.p1 TRINITY_DN27527_c0_g1~~TRINITY_DN27527_c0_g1_i1.p1  ORF type:complete len:179 (-),score=52.37 TRINITY_DN27527_c0_g1_i1:35-571(-)
MRFWLVLAVWTALGLRYSLADHQHHTLCSLAMSSSRRYLGNLTIHHRHSAPLRLREHFTTICNQGGLEGATFYRVVRGVIIMAGHGQAEKEDQFGVYEDPSENTFSSPGVVGLANSGNPDMFGSELFITLIPSPWLDGRYHALGRVVRGMRVAKEIGNMGGSSGLPATSIQIQSCKCF